VSDQKFKVSTWCLYASIQWSSVAEFLKRVNHLARNYRGSTLEYILSTQVSIFKGSSSHTWSLRVVSWLKVVIYWWRRGLVFIHNLIDSKRIRKKEDSHSRMTRTPSTVFLKLHEYSYEWLWLIGSYLQ
jgi:hypothetical protein